MVKLDKNLEKEHFDYLNHHNICEVIDSAIIENLKKIYGLIDTEIPFHSNYKNRTVKPELVYLSKDKRGILLIEETSNPLNKKEQLLKYINITYDSLKMLAKTDYPPNLDIFLVVPSDKRSDALELYKEIEPNLSLKIRRSRGLSVWYYPKSKKCIKNAGGTFSEFFPKEKKELPSSGIGTFKILKESVSRVYLLIQMVMEAFSKEYGNMREGMEVEIDKDKLTDIMKSFGIMNENRWREIIQIGEYVKWFKNVDLNQFNFTIKYSKVNATSIGKSKRLASDFFNAIKEKHDEKQMSLQEFFKEDELEEED